MGCIPLLHSHHTSAFICATPRSASACPAPGPSARGPASQGVHTRADLRAHAWRRPRFYPLQKCVQVCTHASRDTMRARKRTLRHDRGRVTVEHAPCTVHGPWRGSTPCVFTVHGPTAGAGPCNTRRGTVERRTVRVSHGENCGIESVLTHDEAAVQIRSARHRDPPAPRLRARTPFRRRPPDGPGLCAAGAPCQSISCRASKRIGSAHGPPAAVCPGAAAASGESLPQVRARSRSRPVRV